MNLRSPLAVFSKWSLGRGAHRKPAASRRGTLRSRRGGLGPLGSLGSWERLGLGMGEMEQLESRALLAADLVLSFNDNIAANVDRSFYSAASEVIYTLTIANKGDATATNAAVTTLLAPAITQKTWTAAYSAGSSGQAVGAGNLNTPITLLAGGKATFTIVATVGGSATGDLESTAAVAAASGETNIADNTATDTDKFVPRSIVVSNDVGLTSTSLVRLVDPTSGGEIAEAFAFAPDLKTGVRSALGDLNGDGKNEVVAVTNYGPVAELAVLRQNVAANGTVTLFRDPSYSLRPFGDAYDRGLNIVVADFDGDGLADVAVAKAFGSGDVKIYKSTPTAVGGPLTLSRSFVPFLGGTGGATIAAADFGTFSGTTVVDAAKQDGKAELVVASGADMAPVVRIYNVAPAAPVVVDSIRPFTSRLRSGMNVSVGLVNADSIPDIILSQGRNGQSVVEVYDGRVAAAANTRLARFTAFGNLARSSAAVFTAGIDTNADGRIDTINVSQGSAGNAVMRRYSTAGVLQGTLSGVAGSLRVATAEPQNQSGFITTASGLQYKHVVVGTGAQATKDTDKVTVDYAGYLLDGTKFDSDNGKQFTLSGVIQGWTEGIKYMKVDGITQFVIPANLAYGSAGSPPSIPANATLVFYVKLNKVN